jgi:hypothetical protein
MVGVLFANGNDDGSRVVGRANWLLASLHIILEQVAPQQVSKEDLVSCLVEESLVFPDKR